MKHVSVKCEDAYLDMIEELKTILQSENPVGKITKSDVIKHAINTLYNVKKSSNKGYNQNFADRYGVK